MNSWFKSNRQGSHKVKHSLASSLSGNQPLPTISETSFQREEYSEEDNSEENNDHYDEERVPQKKNRQHNFNCSERVLFTSNICKNRETKISSMRQFFPAQTSWIQKKQLIFEQTDQKKSTTDKKKSTDQLPSVDFHSSSKELVSSRRMNSYPSGQEKTDTNSRRNWSTGRKNDFREHVISITQHCSSQVGLAIYNTKTGEIKLAQIIERLNYMRTISTIQRFYPVEILFSLTLQETPLIKQLKNYFNNTRFQPLKRIYFNDIKGYNVYKRRGNQEDHTSENKFLSYAALSALIQFMEESIEVNICKGALNIKQHLLEELLVISPKTISDLEIFLNAKTKTYEGSFIENFRCLTDGGARMLRANFFQPLKQEKKLKERLNFLEFLIENKNFYEFLWKKMTDFNHYESITAKFIQSPKLGGNIKSSKSYLQNILLLSRYCLKLRQLKVQLQKSSCQSQVMRNLLKKLNDKRLEELKTLIEQYFDEGVLKNFQNGRRQQKKDDFIFLFKLEKIEEEFAQLTRINYTHTVEQITNLFEKIKFQSKQDLKLVYNGIRGYYIQAKTGVDLEKLTERISDSLSYINNYSNKVAFSTSMLSSLNNRLKESQARLILQSEGLLSWVIRQIQHNLEILFEINYLISEIDMMLSFVGFIKYYQKQNTQFCRPEFVSEDIFDVEKMKAVWVMEKYHKISKEVSISFNPSKKGIVYKKELNCYEQLGTLFSIGYLVILSQVGCLVPAHNFTLKPFDILVSKTTCQDSLENNLSHFECQLHQLKNIIENSAFSKCYCLILIDEILKGTQHEEECAMSLAGMNQICRRNGKSITLVSDNFLFKKISLKFGKAFLFEGADSQDLKQQEKQLSQIMLKQYHLPKAFVNSFWDLSLIQDRMQK